MQSSQIQYLKVLFQKVVLISASIQSAHARHSSGTHQLLFDNLVTGKHNDIKTYKISVQTNNENIGKETFMLSPLHNITKVYPSKKGLHRSYPKKYIQWAHFQLKLQMSET